ncbi:colicin immunity domain-containing protein [Streptomyces griseorubiginosus]|uniref:colicin immunity domain-containing protein n=1 Tax=Streptomyces griseorubiginosus TaxID=67304 RepID=UPI0036E15ADF
MDEFVDGARSAGEFAQGWWDARRTSQQNGERIKAPLADLFDRVFMILEDYAADPDLREPGDLTDEELHAAIQELRDIFRESLAE